VGTEPALPCPGHRHSRRVQQPGCAELPKGSEGLCPAPVKAQTSPEIRIWPGIPERWNWPESAAQG